MAAPVAVGLMWTLYVRDANLDRVAEIDDFTLLDANLKFNGVSNWILEVPAGTSVAAALSAEHAGLVAVRDGVTVLSGPRTHRRRIYNEDDDHIVFAGPDDTVWLARRLAFPEAPATTTATDAYDVRAGAAETVMRQFVDVNAGPSAASQRQVDGLTLAADTGLGTSVTGRGRFHPLLELLQGLAVAGGDLGFKVVQSGSGIEFQVYDPSDLTATAIFSPDFENLAGFDYAQEAAEANWVIVGGGGEGTARTFVTRQSSPSVSRWGRIEKFVDQRNTTDGDELGQAGDETLTEEASKTSLKIEPVDTDALSFGDYGLGDKVTVVVDGVDVADVIRQIGIRLDDDGETITPLVATPDGRGPDVPAFFDELRRASARVGALERR